jgi:type IX secretion system substrate protein
MKRSFIFILIVIPFSVFGQSIEREVIAGAGDYFESISMNISWTLGELAIETFTSDNLTLSQGFQQGDLSVTAIPGPLLEFQLKVYPNPVVDILIVETKKLDVFYQLIDASGKVLENGFFSSDSNELDFTSIPGGVYFLQIEENQTHKIIKK